MRQKIVPSNEFISSGLHSASNHVDVQICVVVNARVAIDNCHCVFTNVACPLFVFGNF